MLRLAVTTSSETFDRMQQPLAARDIAVEHLSAVSRTIRLTDTADDFDVGFVYPTRLMEGGALTAQRQLPWVNGREAVLSSRNKAGVIAALSRAGLPVPETRMVSNPVDEETVINAVADLSFPLVVKPNSATRGVGVAKVSDVDSLLGVVDYLNLVHDYRATGDKSYLIQEFVPNARDYRIMVLDGEVVGGVERRLPESLDEGRWKHNVHRGAEATELTVSERHRELAVSVAEALGIDYLGVDLLVTGELTVVSETNARPTIDHEKYASDFWDRLAALIRRTAEQS
ncbi:SSU ribosomal protein s6p modification protein [Halogeometricum borinquense DSM 11551]|uniref:SSU ribosomal protein S6P modification protein n=1 Tax=Halogeometricum borinquense (strain ATCC 700274 / DSM 11551 / JCM 10706 / KCTC 4070 / PR3) TaxID=469382 RepID=E4NTU6_HALBP|nr:RimK family alpha-L-glutamate ligase [Halogeometricum borinquense]ADQ68251.1 SSU ribosomal protein S6P modification protein [Halogeometricum borinquense DSM 11551]ELY24705.1 SSU ribosomal protein s6p modification protein [Halogeometricum borinquense DSM 11551]